MKVPEVVVFDLGKVLVDFDYSLAARKIAARSAVSAAEVHRFIEHSPLLYRFETGQLTAEQFFTEVQQAAQYQGTFAEFTAYFADIFTEMPPMTQLHARLRAQDVPTFIFSNTNELAVTHIRRNFPFFANFTDYILSYEHGAMKPEPKLYEVVEARSGRRGEQILYLDDRAENIAAGAARGWRTILQESPEKTFRQLAATGLLPG